jgi:glycolate dehydrogenase FAD-linked subunit
VIAADIVDAFVSLLGAAHVKSDAESRTLYGTDALKRAAAADLVVFPGTTEDVAAVVRVCADRRLPMVPRGAGTGYTGGSVPVRGGVVISLERMNRILEIDEANLLAVVEPNVVTGDVQDAVEQVGLFYPPDPASLRQSVVGGNVAEAVLPTGEVIHTGGKTVKNVVGYDLTQLLVGSEGTLAIITKIILRLVPKPPAQITLRATFPDVESSAAAVVNITRARVVPAALELIDGDSLEAVARYLNVRSLAPEGTAALLLLEVDGIAEAIDEEATRIEEACRAAGATEILRARTEEERQELWRVRRELSFSLKTIATLKLNHDVVVPKGRIPDLFALVRGIRQRFTLRIPCFGHAGDGNIHVNIMADKDNRAEVARAHEAEELLFGGVIALEGSISGEHGIGFAKARFLPLELSDEEIELMKRVKRAFDPLGILNPGKIFP